MTRTDKLEYVTAEPDRLLDLPAFPVTYPVVFNRELIAERPLGTMEALWARGVFSAQHAAIFSLRDVYILGTRFVFDQKLRFIRNVSHNETFERVAVMHAALQDAISTGRVEELTGPTAIILGMAHYNYGHFLVELLPVATVCSEFAGSEKLSFLVPHVAPPMLDVVFRALRLAGIDLARVKVQPPNGVAVRCQNALVVTGLTNHGAYMSALPGQILNGLAEQVPPSAHRKLFVTRARTASRPLLNEHLFIDRLLQAGYTLVDTEKLSLDQQIALFKGAECVVGVSGAAMTNIVFCQPGTSVVSLLPANFADTFFWFIAIHRQLPYMEIRGDQAAYDKHDSWQRGFAIREPDIRFIETLTPDTVPRLIRSAASVAIVLTVHVRNSGDISFGPHRWAGRPGSGLWIEGFALQAPPEFPPDALTYCVLLDDGEESPWVSAGQYAGTRSKMQPILGFRIRLREDIAARYTLRYAGRFTDGSQSPPHTSPDLCTAADPIPLEALRIELLPTA